MTTGGSGFVASPARSVAGRSSGCALPELRCRRTLRRAKLSAGDEQVRHLADRVRAIRTAIGFSASSSDVDVPATFCWVGRRPRTARPRSRRERFGSRDRAALLGPPLLPRHVARTSSAPTWSGPPRRLTGITGVRADRSQDRRLAHTQTKPTSFARSSACVWAMDIPRGDCAIPDAARSVAATPGPAAAICALGRLQLLRRQDDDARRRPSSSGATTWT